LILRPAFQRVFSAIALIARHALAMMACEQTILRARMRGGDAQQRCSGERRQKMRSEERSRQMRRGDRAEDMRDMPQALRSASR